MITVNITLAEIKKYDICRRNFRYFAYDSTDSGSWTLSDENMTLLDLQEKFITWNASDMAYGLNAFVSQDESTAELDVYDENETARNPEKKDVKLFFFKADESRKRNRTCIFASGGAYTAVYSLVESFPVAAAFAGMGFDVFCLNYRVGGKDPLFPKPIEDMAAAVMFLYKYEETLKISMKDYAVGGFSAGGHLAACFGTKEAGYALYRVPRPGAVILNYPMTDVWENAKIFPEPLKTDMLKSCFGVKYSKNISDKYNPTLLADGDYPPCFIAQTKNDSTVPIDFTEKFAERLVSSGVPVEFYKPEKGFHGYGLGSGCDASDWPERAVSFYTSIMS